MSRSSAPDESLDRRHTFAPIPLLLLTLVLCGLAGAMAWGIRGQYGHETGAMMFGPLVGFTLIMLYLHQADSLTGARAVALLSMAVGIGGSMSYGQTVGLTHDIAVHGTVVGQYIDDDGVQRNRYERKPGEWNNSAYWWGMTGLAVKGGLWIGFAGLLFGMGLGGRRYHPVELLLLMGAAILLLIFGIWLLNTPFQPDDRILPAIYFSDHWQWEPDIEVQPRVENWGGILFAFLGFMTYLQFVKRDQLAVNLGLWGLIGGLGFPIGQSLQAWHASDSGGFQDSMPFVWGINHWNLMECSFGFVAGSVLGLGVWIHRRRIVQSGAEKPVMLSLSWEVCLIVGYLYLMISAWFLEETQLGRFYEFGLVMAVIPMVGILGGRYWPYLYALPIVAMPIAGKTFRAVSIGTDAKPPLVPTDIGWLFILTLPLLLLTIFASHCAKPEQAHVKANRFGAWGLMATSTCFFLFNFVFLGFPWSWLEEWTLQRNSGMIYVIAWVVLMTAACVVAGKSRKTKRT